MPPPIKLKAMVIGNCQAARDAWRKGDRFIFRLIRAGDVALLVRAQMLALSYPPGEIKSDHDVMAVKR